MTSPPRRLLLVCGTRPEAIKMAPLMRHLRTTPNVEARLCASGQHRGMLDRVLELFDLVPDHDLDVMREGQGLVDVSATIMRGLQRVFDEWLPDLVLVHGDTNTAFAAALAAYYNHVSVAHVEAGLRTGDLLSPWPEEGNRRLIGALASRHYAPSPAARDNLLAENVDPSRIRVTGNTVIDALLSITSRLAREPSLAAAALRGLPDIDAARHLVLVTGHRRENVGRGFEQVCRAIARLAGRGDVQVLYPVHPNPLVREPVERLLGDVPGVCLIEPLGYLAFVHLMGRARLIVTDSGGVQEEAPALGTPVLVTRATTERPEAVAAGTVRLVGTDTALLVAEATRLLDDDAHHSAMSRAINPYGQGDACRLIVADILGTEAVASLPESPSSMPLRKGAPDGARAVPRTRREPLVGEPVVSGS